MTGTLREFKVLYAFHRAQNNFPKNGNFTSTYSRYCVDYSIKVSWIHFETRDRCQQEDSIRSSSKFTYADVPSCV